MNDPPIDIQLWHVADCPLVDRVRATLQRCLAQRAMSTDVHEREGPCPSPTLLINDIDVVTGALPARDVCCRLDLPTEDQILAALSGKES